MGTAAGGRDRSGATVEGIRAVPATFLRCDGCGFRVPDGTPAPFSCPNALPGDDIDHVLARELAPARLSWPFLADVEPNPFIRYRTLFHAWHAARLLGWTDDDFVALVTHLDESVAAIDGHGFRETALREEPTLAMALGFAHPGGILIKDETGNVSGSHKGRHLFGTLLELTVGEAATKRPRRKLPRLAIASCGNAALAAAVVARAAGRPLDVFIPPNADPTVVARLGSLGAEVVACPRRPGQVGDPTYVRLLEAVDSGAVPFACMGNLNAYSVEGGATLGWEIVDQLRHRGGRLDRIVVQAGAGGLAAACMMAFADAVALGLDVSVPRLHAVQTESASPLARAYELLASRLLAQVPASGLLLRSDPEACAKVLRRHVASEQGLAELTQAARHRSRFMWPWETEPHSAAYGILDDETYDWYAVVRAMLQTGGYPVVVSEEAVLAANKLAHDTTAIDVDHTGSAGLAGLLELVRRGAISASETVAVLFTGVRRHGARPE